ncbi:hypothetical protein Pmani_022402 [Petrolisthes manimaculis]|uniref:Uncharacterized protein n=1 Tax=Petrolisthes manimaculis TaxID=1843537 RepID=A0AAE1PC66_9EUCA|nr:hypothetical protein Pmani_022402 [Petrolisthes manimaculis]
MKSSTTGTSTITTIPFSITISLPLLSPSPLHFTTSTITTNLFSITISLPLLSPSPLHFTTSTITTNLFSITISLPLLSASLQLSQFLSFHQHQRSVSSLPANPFT